VSMEDAQSIINLSEVRNFLSHYVHTQPWNCATCESNLSKVSFIMFPDF
jgi:hypothetical protein